MATGVHQAPLLRPDTDGHDAQGRGVVSGDYLSYGMLQEGHVPGRGEETRRVRELRSEMKRLFFCLRYFC